MGVWTQGAIIRSPLDPEERQRLMHCRYAACQPVRYSCVHYHLTGKQFVKPIITDV
jgi:hypothetical protein